MLMNYKAIGSESGAWVHGKAHELSVDSLGQHYLCDTLIDINTLCVGILKKTVISQTGERIPLFSGDIIQSSLNHPKTIIAYDKDSASFINHSLTMKPQIKGYSPRDWVRAYVYGNIHDTCIIQAEGRYGKVHGVTLTVRYYGNKATAYLDGHEIKDGGYILTKVDGDMLNVAPYARNNLTMRLTHSAYTFCGTSVTEKDVDGIFAEVWEERAYIDGTELIKSNSLGIRLFGQTKSYSHKEGNMLFFSDANGMYLFDPKNPQIVGHIVNVI